MDLRSGPAQLWQLVPQRDRGAGQLLPRRLQEPPAGDHAHHGGGIGVGGITGGTPSLFNVGSVHTDGVDAAATLHFGPHFSLYDAISYNNSTYQSDYTTKGSGACAATGTCIGGIAIDAATGTVPTCGKQVPGSPMWLNKTAASANFGIFDAQLVGDYVGKRFATFTNDAFVGSFFLLGGRIGVDLPLAGLTGLPVRKATISVNVTNITKETGVSTVSVGSANNTYNVYLIVPRQWFATFGVSF